MIEIEMPNAKRGRPTLVDLTGEDENPEGFKRGRVSEVSFVPPRGKSASGPARANYDVVDLIGGDGEEVPNRSKPISRKRACRKQILEVFPGEWKSENFEGVFLLKLPCLDSFSCLIVNAVIFTRGVLVLRLPCGFLFMSHTL